jgi:hypothetical protein
MGPLQPWFQITADYLRRPGAAECCIRQQQFFPWAERDPRVP